MHRHIRWACTAVLLVCSGPIAQAQQARVDQAVHEGYARGLERTVRQEVEALLAG